METKAERIRGLLTLHNMSVNKLAKELDVLPKFNSSMVKGYCWA